MRKTFIATGLFIAVAANLFAQRKPVIDFNTPVDTRRVVDQRHDTQFRPVLVETEITKRQAVHTAVLKRFNIDDISKLGKLTISGTVVPSIGVTTPQVAPSAARVQVERAQRVLRSGAGQTLVPLKGEARVLAALPWSNDSATRGRGERQHQAMKTAAASDLPLDSAYIAAQWLHVPDDTTFVLKFPLRTLYIIAEQATFGSNVTFTYERQKGDPPAVPLKKGAPGKPAPPSNFSTGVTGGNGDKGDDGAPGAGPFAEAPRVEIWVTDMTGSPAFDLRGQDGDQGGRGGDGANGGAGGDGSAAQNATVGCKRGPGAGGNGGNGGAGGTGGRGGDGATGGAFTLYAPSAVITAYTSSGFYISTDPGQGGPGGMPGAAGDGGAPGNVGQLSSRCGDHGRQKGNAGSQGPAGAQGVSGTAGTKSSAQPVKFIPITASDFVLAWANPALETLTPSTSPAGKAIEGEIVSAKGQRFTQYDVVEMLNHGGQWVPAPTTVVANTLLKFKVPVVAGGVRQARVRQVTGRLSNSATIYIAATLVKTDPARVTPGSKVKIIGTGLAPNMHVRINNFNATPSGTTYLDPHTLEATLVRPSGGVESNPAGENVKLTADLNGTLSNAIAAVLDTFVIGAMGDSIIAGVGLDERDTIPAQVAQALKSQPGNRSVHVQPIAHTGAKIGITPYDSPGLPPVDRQVPTRYPTIREQVVTYGAAAAGGAQYVDLIIVDGGANDVGMSVWMDPNSSAAAIKAAVEQASYKDMYALLEIIAAKFPNAQVVVAGNYAPVSEFSDYKMLVPMLNALQSIWYNIPGNLLDTLGPGPRKRLVENCKTFSDEANVRLAQAVGEINQKLGGKKRFFFADPKFGPMNAAATGNQSWLFGLQLLTDGVLKPEDHPDVAAARAAACKAVGSPRTEVKFCERASAGHPTATGAKAYAQAIVAALQ